MSPANRETFHPRNFCHLRYAEWAAPILTVPKPNSKFQFCGDYKVTVNEALEVNQYLLPKPDNLFTMLTGGEKFLALHLS